MKFIYVTILLILGLGLFCQTKEENQFVKKNERSNFVKQKTAFIDSVFRQLPDSKNEKAYMSAFWATELMLRKSEKAKSNLNYALRNFSLFSDNFKRLILQNTYSLYPVEFVHEIDSLQNTEQNDKRFCIMSNYLIRENSVEIGKCIENMKHRFPAWNENPILTAFVIEHSYQQPLTNKQIEELITFRKAKKEATIFIFLKKDRDIPGIAMILDGNGNFLKVKNDTLKIRLLARSITNISGYITNGNTPTGVYSVQGFGKSDNIFIGKTATINTVLPYEINLTEFSHGKMNNEWSLEAYNRFFPDSWQNFTGKNMAYYAGKAGRSEIIIHGTTIDTDFYKDQRFYPFTPSLGCLCTLERWDDKTGNMIESEQKKLVEALKENKIEKAFMYVIEK